MALGIVVRTRVPGPYATQHTQGFGAMRYGKKKQGGAPVKPIGQIATAAEAEAYARAGNGAAIASKATAVQGGLPESSSAIEAWTRAARAYDDARRAAIAPGAVVADLVAKLRDADGLADQAKAATTQALAQAKQQADAQAQNATTPEEKAAAEAEQARLAQAESNLNVIGGRSPSQTAAGLPWKWIGAGLGVAALGALVLLVKKR